MYHGDFTSWKAAQVVVRLEPGQMHLAFYHGEDLWIILLDGVLTFLIACFLVPRTNDRCAKKDLILISISRINFIKRIHFSILFADLHLDHFPPPFLLILIISQGNNSKIYKFKREKKEERNRRKFNLKISSRNKMRIVECPDDCVENRRRETEATKEQLRFGDQRQRAATGANKTPAEGVEITLLFTRADIRLDIKPSIPLLDLLTSDPRGA